MSAANGTLTEVSVLADSLIGLYALEPLLREMLRRNVYQYVHCVPSAAAKIEQLFDAGERRRIELIPLDAREQRGAMYLHRMLRQLSTRPSFSFQYRLISDPRQFPGDWRYALAAYAAKLSPGLPHARVNGFLNAAIRPFSRNVFRTKRVLAISRTGYPHLLCASGLEVMTVLESWDHPVKWPVGHRSDAVFVWNEDLARDWRQYQGDRDVSATYPLKLRYWLERHLPVRSSCGRRIAVYAAGTSSMSYINDIHRYELQVLDAVCEATRRAGWQLLIKPKPNGKTGDFDALTTRYSHVRVGAYRDANQPSDYYLDDDYNRQRELELEQGDLVINAVTTFVLDAALGGVPTLQLDLRRCAEYKGMAQAQTNHHLQRHLLEATPLTLQIASGALVEQLAAHLRQPDGRARRLSEHLRAWLRPKQTLAESLSSMADRVLSLRTSEHVTHDATRVADRRGAM